MASSKSRSLCIIQKRFINEGKEDHVCRLKKSFYGLKQSPRLWYLRFNTFMIEHGYSRSKYDSCVYHWNSMMVLLYICFCMLVTC